MLRICFLKSIVDLLAEMICLGRGEAARLNVVHRTVRSGKCGVDLVPGGVQNDY